MEMRKCLNGHYYDASIHSECPYCTGTNENGVTVPLNMANDDNNKTMPLGYVAPAPAAPASDRTMPLSSAVADNDDGRTVALIKHDIGIDPVVGWLVCIDGKEKGRDYRIHSDNNFIGRSDGRRRITIGCNSKLKSRLTPIRPRGLACNCTFLSA